MAGIVNLNHKVLIKNPEQIEKEINFYPRWIFPLKFLLLLFCAATLIFLLFYKELFNVDKINLILSIMLSVLIVVPLIITTKRIFEIFFGAVKTNFTKEITYNPPVTILMKLGYDEKVNMKAINSVIDIDYPCFELILLSNIKKKYSNFNKNLIGIHETHTSKIKISLIHDPNSTELKLLNAGIKISKTDFIAMVKSNVVINRDVLLKSIRHFSDKAVAVVLGDEYVNRKSNFFSRIVNYNRFVDKCLNRGMLNYKNKNWIESHSFFVFKKENMGRINFISLGKGKKINLLFNGFVSEIKTVFDSSIKGFTISQSNEEKSLFYFIEKELYLFNVLIRNWNELYLRDGNLRERFLINVEIIKSVILPVVTFSSIIVFFTTVTIFAKFEYIFYWLILISSINFIKIIFSSAIDFSISIFILPGILFKWFTDFIKISLDIVFKNEVLFNSLNYLKIKTEKNG